MVQTRSLTDAGVSAREAEVLEALGEHLTNAEIANRLFISVRTVESHVSSLLRKLGLHDRRELAQLAAATAAAETAETPQTARTAQTAHTAADRATAPPGPRARRPAPGLPVPLTPFVGRVAERRALAAALTENRLVTAVGQGGVGKTRLALAVAGDVAGSFDDTWWVDLAPVTDPAMIASAVASVAGLDVPSARSTEDTVIEALAHCSGLVVLDNCEHLVGGVVVFVERLLTHCPRLVVLATSRARLLVPFERVFPVSGLSYDRAESDEPGDAVALFLARAEAVGSPVRSRQDQRRVADICRALDGVALAIELAAARLPALGLDGLEAGLSDRLRLLAGGSRAEDRHSSLRCALDWSFDLLEPVDQAVLRRLSVFASAFTVEAAAAVAGFAPVPEGKETEATLDAIGGLVEQSLVVVVPGSAGTRYRVLETIRQYGADWLDAAGEGEQVRQRHLDWCASVAGDLEEQETEETGGPTSDEAWRRAFDAVADDLRATLGWVVEHPERRAEAHALALRLAELTYRRGLLPEAQRRYEQAAGLTEGIARAQALRRAGGAATSRQAGDDAIPLYQAAGEAARVAGDRREAARDLAWAAMLARRATGIVATQPPPLDVDAVLAEARELAGDDQVALAAVLVAEAIDCEETDPRALEAGQRALALAQQVGDTLLESAALDALTVVYVATGDHPAAVDCTRRRMELLSGVPLDADTAFELFDAQHMAVEAHIGVGDLPSARRYAEHMLGFVSYAEGHLATLRLVVADALAGKWDQVLDLAARFRTDWERLGRPPLPYLALGAGAVTMVHGLRGDPTQVGWFHATQVLGEADEAQAEWFHTSEVLREAMDRSKSQGVNSWAPTFDAIVLLHHGRFDEAVSVLSYDPAELRHWYSGMWRQWYAALWAEAAVLTGHPEAEARLARARDVAAGNPIASAIVSRADGWRSGDRDALLAAADALAAADCPYQQARTLVLAGGLEATRGAEILAAIGAAPMAPPPDIRR